MAIPSPRHRIRSRGPGRICLFGEHQDYMGLRVVAAAVDLAIFIDGETGPGDQVDIFLRDFGQRVRFSMEDIRYQSGRDYLRSGVKLLLRKEIITPCSIRAELRGTIPIQAGTSSSSALVVAWLAFLIRAAASDPDRYLRPEWLGELGYLAEVAEFDEAGGRMDQYASAFGGIVALDFSAELQVRPLPLVMREFVLGDSLQPKPTQKTLKRIRGGQEAGLQSLREIFPFQRSLDVAFEDVQPRLSMLPAELRPYLRGVIRNREITAAAIEELTRPSPGQEKLAGLMNEHQSVLRDDLRLSTSRLDAMIDGALKAGALAAKINGSGEGGCMFAYCPGRQKMVAEAVARAGGRPYVIQVQRGAGAESIVSEREGEDEPDRPVRPGEL